MYHCILCIYSVQINLSITIKASQGSGSTGTTAAQGGGAIAQYLQDRLNGTGGGFIYQQGQQRSQAANPYGVGKKTIVAGIGGSSKNLVAGAGTKYCNDYEYAYRLNIIMMMNMLIMLFGYGGAP
jgi:hypothetical protein